MNLDAAWGGLLPGSLAASVLGAAWAIGLLLLLGSAALRLLRHEGTDAAIDLATCCAIGVPLLSVVVLCGSGPGLLTPRGVVAGAVVLTFAAAAAGGARLLRTLRGLRASRADLLIVPALAAAFVLATLPSVHHDDLVYHLGLPRQALILGHWPDLPHFHHALMPASWESCFLLPLAIGGGSGPQLMNAGLLALLAAAALALARQAAPPLAAALAVATLLGSRVMISSGAQAGNDLAVGLALLAAFAHASRAAAPRAAVIAGACAGAAASMKFTGLLGAACILAVLLVAGEGGLPSRMRRCAAAGIPVLLLALPWSIRALALTGNPVYPAFFGVLGGRGWSEVAAELLSRDSAMGAWPARGVAAFLHAPGDLLVRNELLGEPAGLCVVLLVLAVPGLIALRSRPIGAYLAACFVAWVLSSLMLRFAIAPLAVLAVPAAAGLQWAVAELRSRAPAAARVLPAAVGVAALAFVAGSIARHLRAYGTGPIARSTVLADRLDLARVEPVLAELPRDARVLVVGEARLAQIPREALLSTALDEPAIGDVLAQALSVDDVSRLIRDRGITHVVVNERELERFTREYRLEDRLGPPRSALLRDWLDSLPELARAGRVVVKKGSGVVLYPPGGF